MSDQVKTQKTGFLTTRLKYNTVYYDIQAANSRGADQNADASDDFGILQIFFDRIFHEGAHLAVAGFQTALKHNKEAIAASSIIKSFQKSFQN